MNKPGAATRRGKASGGSSGRQRTGRTRSWPEVLEGRHGGDASEVELAKTPTVFNQFTFALEDVNLDVGLTLRMSGEHLGGFSRNRGVGHDQFGDRAAEGFNAQ